MEAKIFKPDGKYKTSMFITRTLIAMVILIGCALMFSLIALDRSARGAGLLIAFLDCAGLDVLWYVPGMILVVPYYNSLKYEIHEDEVIVNAGCNHQICQACTVPHDYQHQHQTRDCWTGCLGWARCISRPPAPVIPPASRKKAWLVWTMCRKSMIWLPKNCGVFAAE